MKAAVSRDIILMIGDDASLAYLLRRYAEQGGYEIASCSNTVTAEEIGRAEPHAVLFPTMDALEKAQSLVVHLSNRDIPVLVCTSVAEEPRARELGADACLVHPLTYDGFITALGAAKIAPQPKHGEAVIDKAARHR